MFSPDQFHKKYSLRVLGIASRSGGKTNSRKNISTNCGVQLIKPIIITNLIYLTNYIIKAKFR